MSWTAKRFQRNRERRSRRNGVAAIDQPHRYAEKDISNEDLTRIFRYSSLEYVLRVCERIKNMKRRDVQISPPERFLTLVLHLHLKKRSRHHLTPRSRKNEAFYGEEWRNVLVLRNKRHRAWHDLFLNQTLEETILVLEMAIETQWRTACAQRESPFQLTPAYAAA